MFGIREDIIKRGNPFSREYREAIVDMMRQLESIAGMQFDQPKPKPEPFVAKLTGSNAILTDRVWKYSWEEQPDGRTSTGGSDAYQFYALNGAEVNNPAVQSSGGSVVATQATFGVSVGDLTDPASTVTLLPLTDGPEPLVVMHQMPRPLTVTIGGSDYDCFYWFHAANQVSVACG